VQTSETRTAQIPVNEPLKSESEPLTQTKAEATPPPVIPISQNRVLELLNKAKNAIQFRKIKKLDRIMNLFSLKSKITNGKKVSGKKVKKWKKVEKGEEKGVRNLSFEV